MTVVLVGCTTPMEHETEIHEWNDKESWVSPVASKESLTIPVQAEAISSTLGLEMTLRWALERNREILIAREKVKEARGNRIQAGLWSNPSMSIESEEGRSGESLGLSGDNKVAIGFSQEIPMGGRISAQKKAAESAMQAAERELEHTIREVQSEIKQAFYAVLASKRTETISKENLALAKELSQAAKAQVDAGAVPQAILLRANLEQSRAEIDLRAAEATQLKRQKHLLVLMGDVNLPVKEFVGELGDTPLNIQLEKLHKEVVTNHPELLAAESEIEQAKAELRLEKVKWRSDPEFSVGVGRIREEGESMTVVEWGVEIPFPAFDQNQGNIAAARSRVRQAEENYHMVKTHLSGEVYSLAGQYDKVSLQVEEFRDHALPDAERVLELVRTGYREGTFSQIEVLDAQRSVAELRTAYLEYLSELNQLSAALESLAGESLLNFTTEGK